MSIFKRNVKGNKTQDQHAVSAITYNEPAGAVKVAEVGRRLIAIPNGAAGTTSAAAAIALPSMGKNIAVYNNAGAVGSITLGSSGTVASLAPGATALVGTDKRVGVPCMPNAWTYIACGQQQWVIASAATLLVFIIEDDTSIAMVSANNAIIG